MRFGVVLFIPSSLSPPSSVLVPSLGESLELSCPMTPLENPSFFQEFVDAACSLDQASVVGICSTFGFPQPDFDTVRSAVRSPSFPHLFEQYMAKGIRANEIPEDLEVVRCFQFLYTVLGRLSNSHLECLRGSLENFPNPQKYSLLNDLASFFVTVDPNRLGPFCGGRLAPEQLREMFRIEDQVVASVLNDLLFRSSEENFIFLHRSLPSLFDGEKKILVSLLSCDPTLWPRFRTIFFRNQPHPTHQPSHQPPPQPVPPEPAPPQPGGPPMQQQPPSSQFSISLLHFPSTNKSIVSRKNLPNPKPGLMLKGDDGGFRAQLFVAPILANFDTGELLPDQLLGAKPLVIMTGKLITFQNLQIKKSSIQLGNIRPCIHFELRRYDRDPKHKGPYELLHWVKSEPIHVVSHSTLCKIAPQADAPPVATKTPPKTTALVVGEVIPETADWRGGTRIAILGENFQDTHHARVRFGSTQIVPEVIGPRTMICYAPRHPLGQVPLSITFDGRVWTPEKPFYFIESIPTFEEVHTIPAFSLDLGSIDNHFGH
uniref:IPT/TIG domain-containing protein n=1 Tax=Paramoeba aestuarina TaxID=180227 RepID=A0A7S4JLG3_9EUKA